MGHALRKAHDRSRARTRAEAAGWPLSDAETLLSSGKPPMKTVECPLGGRVKIESRRFLGDVVGPVNCLLQGASQRGLLVWGRSLELFAIGPAMNCLLWCPRKREQAPVS